MAETLARFPDRVLENIVAKNQQDRIAAREILGQSQRLGNSSRTFLIGVIRGLQPRLAAISQEPDELTGAIPGGYQPHLSDPRLASQCSRVWRSRSVHDRHHRL